jgi:methyl-accepting chemotaxis protein
MAAVTAQWYLDREASAAWSRAQGWSVAVAASGEQRAGTIWQMRAQSLGVALMDPSYTAAFAQGVQRANAAAKVIDGLHDPVIARISAESNAADHAHDAAVNEHLWPAVRSGDAPSAQAALRTADANASKVLAGLDRIGAHIDERTSAARAAAKARARQAVQATIVASLLAVAAATLLAVLIGRAVSRRARGIARGLERAAEGDLTSSCPTAGAAEFRRIGHAANEMTSWRPSRPRSRPSSRRSGASRSRRTCSRSTPRSRRRAPASRDAASRSWRRRCASSPRRRSRPPARSRR